VAVVQRAFVPWNTGGVDAGLLGLSRGRLGFSGPLAAGADSAGTGTGTGSAGSAGTTP
jgi:hypothetical protein